ncbi:MAG: carbamoyltransferase N-terminal domain-containing protein [Planctomycetota bacterium]
MTAILGISCDFHDSAAALIVDGQLIAASQQERYSRLKHDAGFPTEAIQDCLAQAGIGQESIDWVGFYEKPWLRFERLLSTYAAYAPHGYRSFAHAMPDWLARKLWVRRRVDKALPNRVPSRLVFCRHHDSHAASAFYPSPFDSAAYLTIDGVGEWATASFGVGDGNELQPLGQLDFPHSLGLLYSAATAYCGFQVNSGEYKLMGLAPYGQPRFASIIKEQCLDLKADGSFRMRMGYFDYPAGLTMTSRAFDRLIGGPPRRPGEPLSDVHLDLAASIQMVTEEIVLKMARHVQQRTRQRHLCLAGGVALNCVVNERLQREGPFDSIWVQPAAGDSGGALGAAFWIHHQLMKHRRTPTCPDGQQGSLLGPRFAKSAIRQWLQDNEIAHDHLPSRAQLCDQVATEIAAGKIVGWFQGRMEYGPRALGNRSLLADPRDPNMQRRLNQQIKQRESFRPFAPAVVCERAAGWFQLGTMPDRPYMTVVATVDPSQQVDLRDQPVLEGLQRLNQIRTTIPAVTHVDDTSRVQTVDAKSHPLFHQLIAAFEKRTGCPLLVNTSFNGSEEPIVCTPEDAMHCFVTNRLDRLVVGDCVIRAEEQPSDVIQRFKQRPGVCTESPLTDDQLLRVSAAQTPGRCLNR